MTLHDIISNLGPGDEFIYKDRIYLFVKTTPIDLGASTDLANWLLAVDLQTYEIMAFDKAWEVEVVSYLGGA
jgi:hypothetical protein